MARQKLLWLGILLLLATSALAYDDDSDSGADEKYPDSGPSTGPEYDDSGNTATVPSVDGPCDPNKQTQTTTLSIKWVDQTPDDCPDFFKSLDIELEWLYDIDDQWSVYTAEDVEDANAIMTDLLDVLAGNELYGDGPMSKPHTKQKIKAHIETVYGACLNILSQAKPAELPAQCSAAPPNSCAVPRYQALNTIRCPPVWSALPGIVNANPSSSMMVIDSGIRPTHLDLRPNLVANLVRTGLNRASVPPNLPLNPPQLFPLTNLPTSPLIAEHGTHVAGTVYARWSNRANSAVGVVGNALGGSCECGFTVPTPTGLAVRIHPDCGVNCINFAALNSRVINLSWGLTVGPPFNQDTPQRRAIAAFCRAGGIVVMAAMNGEPSIPGNPNSPANGVDIIRPNFRIYPQAYAQELAAEFPTCMINVAATTRDGTTFTRFSNFGQFVQVAAPGENIVSTSSASNDGTMEMSGTSMAAPHVAGMATLLFNAFPGASQRQVYTCIVSTATRPVAQNPQNPNTQRIAGGLVDLEAAYRCMRENPVCPTTGLPACVDPRSGQPVEGCDTRNRFCRPIPNNNRFVCQYSFRPEGSLCPLNAPAQSLAESAAFLEEMSAAEIQEMGLEAEPSVQIASASEPQQARNNNRNNKAQPCGRCQNNVCVAADKKWCKQARQRAANDAGTVANAI